MRPSVGSTEAITQRICTTALSEKEALAVLQQEYATNPHIDVALLNYAVSDGEPWLPRVLRLLCHVSTGQRLTGVLLPLLKVPDSAIRALAAFLVAKGRTNNEWALEMLNDPDPRVRANVIEGLRVESACLELFRAALKDAHHRVVANAIVSLHRLKPEEARQHLGVMTQHEDWNFRAAAAWACGAIGTTDCAELARGMRTDPHPSVRWNALRACSVIHRSNKR